MKCKNNFCLVVALLILMLTILFNFEKGRSHYFAQTKRGYILDRKGEPIVLNREFFQAFYLLKGKSFLGQDVPEEIKPYLPKILDLPEKGVFLLSENLTLEEVRKLSKVKNVSIKSSVERRVLYRGIRALIGDVTEDKGLFGLEQAFDTRLQRGESVMTSLDTNLLKKGYNLINKYPSYRFKGLAQFKMKTGELISYYSSEAKDWLGEPFTIQADFNLNIPEKITWELGSFTLEKSNQRLRLTPLHLVSAYLTQNCGKGLMPTLILKEEISCQEIKGEREELFLILPNTKEWLLFYPKEEFLYVLKGEFGTSDKEEISLDKFKQNLKYLISLLDYAKIN